MTDKEIQDLAKQAFIKPLFQTAKNVIKPLFDKAVDFGAKNYQGIKTTALTDTERWAAPKARTMFGFGSEAKLVGKAENINPNLPTGHGQGIISSLSPKHIASEFGHAVGEVKNKGFMNFFSDQIENARNFQKGGHTYRRSIPGQIANVVGMTGPGIAVTDLAMKNPGESTGHQIARAGTDLAVWGISPRLGVASMLGRSAFDILKKRNAQQTINQTI